MELSPDMTNEARRLAERRAGEIGADPGHLAEIVADEVAVLNGHCPEPDEADLIESRLRQLDS